MCVLQKRTKLLAFFFSYSSSFMGTKQRIEILTQKKKKKRKLKSRGAPTLQCFFFFLPVLYLGFELLNGFFTGSVVIDVREAISQ
jgi:hypothetical protein